MQEYVWVSSVNLDAAKVRQLEQIAPQPERDSEFYYGFRLLRTDERVKTILKLLREFGKEPKPADGHKFENHQFSMYFQREYDEKDLASAELLQLRPLNWVGDLREGPISKRIVIKSPKASLRADVGTSVGSSWIVVPNRVKKGLQKSGLRNIRFHETVLYAGYRNLEQTPWEVSGRKPWWELDSDMVMPRLSSSMKFKNKHGDPTDGTDRENGCLAIEGFYQWPELHYRRSDLAGMPEFDLARTWEGFDARRLHDFDRAFVCSQRFYQFFVQQGWKTNWIPVRIEE